MTQDCSRPLDSPAVLDYGAESVSLPRSQSARLGVQLGLGALILAIVVAAIYPGLRLRQWIYAESVPIRFHGDIRNAWLQGYAVVNAARETNPDYPVTFNALMRSYLTRYDAVVEGGGRGIFRLDYPPARLLVMSLWVWQMGDLAEQRKLSPSNFPIVWPLLCLNTLFELAGCAGAYLVVRHVLRRQQIRGADFVALIAPLLMWFNLAVILDAHVWPQWDAWIIPFYTFAAYFALTRRWIFTGACIALGAMFKGQMLLTAVVFLLWPLFQMRWRAVLEVIAGVLAAAMVYVLPWMVRSTWAWIPLAVALSLLIFGMRWIRRDWQSLYLAGGVGAAVLVTGLMFDGSFAWWLIGFERGSRQYMSMNMGPTPNLGAMLSHQGWNVADVLFTLGWPLNIEVSVRQFMLSIYAIALLMCGIGLAHHDARNDRRVLIALATPWVVMFAFLAQMHDRYLVWGAVLTALAAGVSLGASLLHLVVTFLACLPLGFNLLNGSGAFSPEAQPLAESWHRFFQRTFPDAGWATVFVALVLLYLAVAPSRRRTLPALPAPT